MNKTKIEWTEFSWNPISGCAHGCWYCYANKITQRFPKNFPNGFKPTYHPERILDPWYLKIPSKIFVCSVADLFAPWTPDTWRMSVLRTILDCPVKHTFQLLTKNPERIPDLHYPDNIWLGTTVTGENNDWCNIDAIKQVWHAKIRFVSFEPLLGSIPFDRKLNLEGIQWVIIGKLTGSRRVKLDWKWVDQILTEANYRNIPVFMKNNLGAEHPRQEFP